MEGEGFLKDITAFMRATNTSIERLKGRIEWQAAQIKELQEIVRKLNSKQ